MRVPIYCNETFEALTIIKLEQWALRMLDQGCIYLRFAPLSRVSATPFSDEQAMMSDQIEVCTIRFDPLRLRDMQTWIGVTDDAVTALALRSVFLPGQESEVRQSEREAQARLIEAMLKDLSS